MRKTLGMVFILTAMLVSFTQAAPPGLIVDIEEVFVNDPANPTMLTINGTGFDLGPAPIVTLGQIGSLSVSSVSATEIQADLPMDIGPGDYLLTVWVGPGESLRDEYDLTIGAVGAQGPEGPPGPQGPAGVTDRYTSSKSLSLATVDRSQSVSASCASGYQLTGCSGYLHYDNPAGVDLWCDGCVYQGATMTSDFTCTAKAWTFIPRDGLRLYVYARCAK